MQLTLAEPWWLLVLALVPLVIVSGLGSLQALSVWRRRAAIAARCVVVVLVALLLARPSAERTTDKLAVIAVVDTSESVRSFVEPAVGRDGETLGPVERVRRWIEAADTSESPENLLGVIAFDGEQIVVLPANAASSIATREIVGSGAEGTDIASALRFAAGLIPADATGRIVLFSDGNATRGDPMEAARELSGGALAVPVDVVPLVYNASGEVVVESLDAPPRAAKESSITLRVAIRATQATSGRLRILAERAGAGEPEEIDANGPEAGNARRVTLSRGVNTQLVQIELPPGRSVHSFKAVFEPDGGGDRSLANNSAEAITITPSNGRIAIIDGAGTEADNPIARVLRDARLEVEVFSPSSMPASLSQLQNFDLVFLMNVASESVEIPTQRSLVSYVREFGGGLVMVGGDQSFGAGGWLNTPVAEALPVLLDLPDEMLLPEAAVVFVIDASGSMNWSVGGGAASKQQVANESAARAVRQLINKRDLVGVIAFSGTYQVVQRLEPNADPKRLASRIMSIGPGGGTNLPPALDEARQQLRRSEAKIKHVLVLTDGQSTGAELLPGMAAEMLAEDDIKVSAIAIGDDADLQGLEDMARSGGGEYAHAKFLNQLPQILFRQIRTISRPMIRETEIDVRMTERGAESVIMSGVGPNLPRIYGIDITRARGEPASVLAVTDREEPLLVQWSFGSGNVVAFMSDAHGSWSRDWRATPSYSRLWTNIARVAARPDFDVQHDLTARIDRGTLKIRAEMYGSDDEPLDGQRVTSRVVGPDGVTRRIDLVQTGPGVYEAQVSATVPGAYNVYALQATSEGTPGFMHAAVVSASGEEFRRLRSDSAVLERIADVTGGRRLSIASPGDTPLFERDGVRERIALTPIWRELLVALLVVMLLDIGNRRIAWDRLIADRRASRAVAARATGRSTSKRHERAVSAPRERRRVAAKASPASTPHTRPVKSERTEPVGDDTDTKQKFVAKEEEAESSGLMAAKKRADDRFEGF